MERKPNRPRSGRVIPQTSSILTELTRRGLAVFAVATTLLTLAMAASAAETAPLARIISPQCPVWAEVSKPMQFVLEGTDPDNDLKNCEIYVDQVLKGSVTFSSTNSGTMTILSYIFGAPGSYLVEFIVWDKTGRSGGASCTVTAVNPILDKKLTVLTYNTHLFEDSPMECIIRSAETYKPSLGLSWAQYAYNDELRKDHIVELLKSCEADIVVLEEVWAYAWRYLVAEELRLSGAYRYSYHIDSSTNCKSGLKDVDTWLPTGMTTLAPFHLPFTEDIKRTFNTLGNGLLLLSKYPLSAPGFKRFPTYTQGSLFVDEALELWSDKGVISVTADVEGTPIRIGVSHALTGPDDYYGSWTHDYIAETLMTIQDTFGQPFVFGVNGPNDHGWLSRLEDYSYADAEGKINHAASWKQVYGASMAWGCAAATSFKLNGATYLFGLHGYGTNAAIIRRLNEDASTGWATNPTYMAPLSVNYKCLTSFELNGEPYIFMIYPPENNVYIRKIKADAKGWTSTYQPMSASFVNFTPFKLNGRPYLVGVHENNNAYVYQVKEDATLTNVNQTSWFTDWVPTPFELNGEQYIFVQSYASPIAHIKLVNDISPSNWTDFPVTNWISSQYFAVKAFEIEGHPYLLCMRKYLSQYDDSTLARKRPRDAFIWRINDDGKGLQQLLQLEDLKMIRDATVVDADGPPAIMMGDFNIHKHKYGIMNEMFAKAGAVDAYVMVHGTGDGGETVAPTNWLYHYFWPTDTESSRIDYVYVKGSGGGVSLQPTSAYVKRDWKLPSPPSSQKEDLSDHYPLFVEFRLQEAAELDVSPAAEGSWRLSVTGITGRNCEVQCSSDLSAWEKLAEFRLTNSPHVFVDPRPASTTGRFYRLRLLP